MNLLLDMHVLLWSAERPDMMSEAADQLIKDPSHRLWFSVASIWEVTIKRRLNRPDFGTDPGVLRAGLLANGYEELPIEGRHIPALAGLPNHHADPFDRLLLCQAITEGMRLVTVDAGVIAYGGPVPGV